MSRIVLAWELGLNQSHLMRLLPLGTRLKGRGHAVLGIARDIPLAAGVFGAEGISFIAAPCVPNGTPLDHRPTGYADVLLSQGWRDHGTLWGLVESWRNLFWMFQPDLVVLDYSPTARLAAHTMGIRAISIGNGFELPPATTPLPAFSKNSQPMIDRALESERIALASANVVIEAFGGKPMQALSELVDTEECLLTTFPDLDHYGARDNGRYVGPLMSPSQTSRIDWPEGPARRIFASLRPDTENVEVILQGLAGCGASVICHAPDFASQQLERFRNSRIAFTSKHVDPQHLQDADLCISYGAEETVSGFLLAGVPQLLVPRFADAHMAARRIEECGVGLILKEAQTVETLISVLKLMLGTPDFKAKAQAFAEWYRGFDSQQAADSVVDLLEDVLTKAE